MDWHFYKSRLQFNRSQGRVLILLLLLIAWSEGAIAGNRPFYGYGNFPSARIFTQGRLLLSMQNYGTQVYPTELGTPDLQLNGSLLTAPLPWLEWGGTYHHTGYAASQESRLRGELGLKIQLPRINVQQPLLSIGIVDVLESNRFAENLYFVGGYHFKGEKFHLALDLGAMYSSQMNPWDSTSKEGVSSFLGLDLDMGRAAFLMELFWQKKSLSFSPSVWAKPLSALPGMTHDLISVGVGVRLDTRESEYPILWGGLQAQIPLERHLDTIQQSPQISEVRGEPWIWLDLRPVFDHSFGTENQYRSALVMDVATRLGLNGLYWVNGLQRDLIRSKDIPLLSPRNAWNSSYLYWESKQQFGGRLKFSVPQIAIGVLSPRHAGIALWESIHLSGWAPMELEGRVQRNDSKSIQKEGSLRLPLHPTLPWFLKWTQLYAEGGVYRDSHIKALAGLVQGSPQNQLRLAGGYDMDSKDWVMDAEIRFAFGNLISVQQSDVQLSIMPQFQHRVSSQYSITEGIGPIQGNAPWRHDLHWQPRMWKGSLNKVLAAQSVEEDLNQNGITDDQVQYPVPKNENDGINEIKEVRPNARVAIEMKDTLQNKDRDADGIDDELDACPDDPEDYDQWEDEDGCPDLDNDRDGIPDVEDACQLEPEIMDGIKDSDGCP